MIEISYRSIYIELAFVLEVFLSILVLESSDRNHHGRRGPKCFFTLRVLVFQFFIQQFCKFSTWSLVICIHILYSRCVLGFPFGQMFNAEFSLVFWTCWAACCCKCFGWRFRFAARGSFVSLHGCHYYLIGQGCR